jgi:hypothetical protein
MYVSHSRIEISLEVNGHLYDLKLELIGDIY